MDYPIPRRISEWVEDLGSHTFHDHRILNQLRAYGIVYYEEQGSLLRRGVHCPVTRWSPAGVRAECMKFGWGLTLDPAAEKLDYMIVGYAASSDIFWLVRATTYPDQILAIPPGNAEEDHTRKFIANINGLIAMGL